MKPLKEGEPCADISLRDYFAGQAMQAMQAIIANHAIFMEIVKKAGSYEKMFKRIAEDSFDQADAMVIESAKRGTHETKA